jgi:hypothetical protein
MNCKLATIFGCTFNNSYKIEIKSLILQHQDDFSPKEGIDSLKY